MIQLIKKFNRLPQIEKKLFFEICFLKLFFGIITYILPFKFYRRFLGDYGIETSKFPDAAEKYFVKLIYRSLYRSSKYFPLFKKCLTKAIVAKYMLNKRGIRTTLYIGLAKNDQKKLIAHAWLKWGNNIITGRRGIENFKAISQFG
jgi:hypothetical protein